MHRTFVAGVVALSLSASPLVVGCGSPEPAEETAASEDELEQNGCHTPDAPNDDVANLQRYAAYRARLRNEFVKVSAGDEPGTNIPASNRQGTTLGWGDATIMMGQYLSMLATEYALLDGRRPAEAQTTLRELHYALRALDRLDRTAESYFREDRTSVPADLNGFFIRDDVAPDFLTRHPLGGGANAVASDTTAPYGGKPGYHATEMSQDQVWHLLVGLALVKTLVSFDGSLDGESIDVPAHAKTITHRILTYMREHDNWRTQNPIFGRDVLRGGDWDARRVFSYGFATAGNWILAPRDATEPSYPDLHNATSRGAKSAFVLA